MERLQRYGGTAGYASAFCLLVLLILSFGVPGPGATYADPAGALAKIAGDRWLWRLSNLAGILASGLAVVFTIGLWVRLREPAPTRATIVLYFALIGLGGYALSGFVLWKGQLSGEGSGRGHACLAGARLHGPRGRGCGERLRGRRLAHRGLGDRGHRRAQPAGGLAGRAHRHPDAVGDSTVRIHG